MSHVTPGKSSLLAVVSLATALLITSSGCLSIGGKTEVVASPENDMRLTSLESRVGALERTLGVSAVPSSLSSADKNRAANSVRPASATSARTSKPDKAEGNGDINGFNFTLNPEGR